MTQPINQAGTFRGRIIQYGMSENDKTGSVSLYIKGRIDEAWNQETQSWDDWRQYEVEADGNLNIIKKDGAGINQKQVESIIEATGWDGSLATIAKQEWTPKACQFAVKPDVYEGVTRYRIDWLNDYERTPGNVGNVDADKAKALDTKYGSSMRALAGNAKRSTATPATSQPPAPKPRTQAAAVPAGAGGNSDIPF